MLRSYLFEAAGVCDARPKMVSRESLRSEAAKRNGLRKAKVAVARKLAISLRRISIDGTSSTGEEGDCCLARRLPSPAKPVGKNVPTGTMAMVGSTDFLRASQKATAIHIHRQRHLTPSCGGPPLPRREQWARQGRSLESLTPRPREAAAGDLLAAEYCTRAQAPTWRGGSEPLLLCREFRRDDALDRGWGRGR